MKLTQKQLRQLIKEELGSYEVEQARTKAEEASSLLAEARDLLEGSNLHSQAEEAFEAAYMLMSMCDDEMTSEDEVDLPPMHPRGQAAEPNLPPMHPRGRGSRA